MAACQRKLDVMTVALTKYIFKGDVWVMRILKVMSAVQLSRFCCLFTLRQGTMLIAITELSLTSFVLFLFLLGATHAQDIIALASNELQQLEEIKWSEENLEESPVYLTNNEKRMLSGQHLAFIIMVVVWTGLLIASIHFISCVLLLYGAIKNSPNFLLPWTSTVLLSLISGCFFLLVLAFFPIQKCKAGTYLAGISLLGLELYAWLAVFSYYRQLKS